MDEYVEHRRIVRSGTVEAPTEITPFRTPGLGDTTYLEHEGRAVLVDPQRDIDRFLPVAAERDLTVRMVLEAHLHNDYVSGAEQVSVTTGA